MRRYGRLWLSFLRASALADFEYRANISVRIFAEFIWYATQLSVFEVLYLHTSTIHGWDVNAMRVFMGTLFFVDNWYMVLFSENMETMSSMVRKGDLDLYLTKPVDSMFMITCRKVSVAQLVNVALIGVYLLWAVPRLGHPVGALDFLAYGVLCVCGLVIYFALRFLFVMIVVLLQEAGNIQFVWHQLFRLATRPDAIYPGPMRLLVMTVLPVAFLASVPARALVEGASLHLFLVAPVLAIGLVLLAHVLWGRVLRRYSSASS